ncbi:MAG TPA: alpha/beta fold hydrolase [Capsulimonadaceae bacterium]
MNKFVKGAIIAGALVAAPAIINNAVFSRAKALGNTIGGEGRFWPWREGDLFYTKQGSGKPPIVLLHGVYAGASVYEWRKNFDALGEHFTVYALDWLGFGLSDKPKIQYTGALYVEMLLDFLREVVGEPAAVVASSLGAAYAIDAAAKSPHLVSDLVLIEPTGLTHLAREADECKMGGVANQVGNLVLGTSVYNGVASVMFLRNYLQNQVYFDPSFVTDEMIEHYSTATHQYGSQYAPLCFISGQLGLDVHDSFPKLSQRTIRLVWGREAKVTPLSDAEAFLAANPRAEMTVFDKAGLLPQDEQASAFNRFVTDLLTQPSEPVATSSNGTAAHASKPKKTKKSAE